MVEDATERYRVLYETITDGIVFIDMNGRIVECNQAFAGMLGYSREELKHFTYRELTPEQWRETDDNILKEQIMKRGYSDEYEKQYIRKDGTVLQASLRGWLITDEDGLPKGMWAVIREIKRRKKAEGELGETDEKAQRYLGTVGSIIVALDRDGRVTLLNRKGCELLGYKEGELDGKIWFETCVPREHREEVRRVFEKCMLEETGEIMESGNPVLTKNGEKKIIRWHHALLKDSDGKVIGTLSSGVNLGVNAYITKPIDHERLDQIIKECLIKQQDVLKITQEKLVRLIDDTIEDRWEERRRRQELQKERDKMLSQLYST